MTKTNRRRTLFVDSELQRRIIRSVVLVPASALVIASIGVMVFAFSLVEEASTVNAELPSLPLLLTWVYTFVALFGLIVLRQVAVLSNRIAGPEARLLEGMRRIRERDFEHRVQLRDGDIGAEIASELNETLAWLDEEFGRSNEAATPEEVDVPANAT